MTRGRVSRALPLLVIAWCLGYCGEHIGSTNPNNASLAVAALLLFGVWRGVRWCRTLLVSLAIAAGAVVLGAGGAAIFGAQGIVVSTLAGLALCAASGAILLTPPIRRLVTRTDPAQPAAARARSKT